MGKHITLGQYFNLLKIANLEFEKKNVKFDGVKLKNYLNFRAKNKLRILNLWTKK